MLHVVALECGGIEALDREILELQAENHHAVREDARSGADRKIAFRRHDGIGDGEHPLIADVLEAHPVVTGKTGPDLEVTAQRPEAHPRAGGDESLLEEGPL